MAQFVCKMCGVSIQSSSSGVVSCPHCGLPQTQPRLDNPEHNELYIQANALRQEKNFKEAQVMFRKLLVDHPEDAELNWSVALCRYGISYGIDPLAGKPVHIISTPRKTRFVEDEHYKTALRCANNAQWPCYADEGTAIDIRIADDAERPGKKKQQHSFKIPFFISSAAALLCVAALAVVLWQYVLGPGQDYEKALSLYNSGNVIRAYDALVALDGYKDSAELAASIYDEYKAEKMKNIQVGSEILLGSYEQDNDTANGKEDILWQVLDIQEGKALVISKYALDGRSYQDKRVATTWESSSLRQWLNDEFLNSAFSDEEKAMLQTTTATADPNPESTVDPGNPTEDRVFLLSMAEAQRYFGSEGARKCKVTGYAQANGAYVYETQETWWWLRSPGTKQTTAGFIDGTGKIRVLGNNVDYGNGGVRPAMWIELKG